MSDGTFYDWAWVGNRVECVKGHAVWSSPKYGSQFPGPKTGDALTISAVLMKDTGLVLAFTAFPEVPVGIGYSAKYFRPLVSEDDMIEAAIFLAKPKHHKRPVKADA